MTLGRIQAGQILPAPYSIHAHGLDVFLEPHGSPDKARLRRLVVCAQILRQTVESGAALVHVKTD